MMRILQLIAGNLLDGPSSIPLPETVTVPGRFRGRVELDPRRCIGCGLCEYVCVSGAITVTPKNHGCNWSYDPGRCAFCARCLERCPAGALTMTAKPLPAYGTPGQLEATQVVSFPPCPECGTPTRPAPERLMRLAFEDLQENTLELAQHCERCRRRRLQRNLSALPAESSKENEG